jgi:class 3 adenylate cyclase
LSREDQTSRIAVLLFTDMVDSVAIERRVGTEAYSRLLMRHHQLFREAQSAVGDGKIHLDTGDGFFAEFTTAARRAGVVTGFVKRSDGRDTVWIDGRPQPMGPASAQYTDPSKVQDARRADAPPIEIRRTK